MTKLLFFTIESVGVKDSIAYEKFPVEILDRKIHRLGNKKVPLVKVLSRNQSVGGAAWEEEEDMQTKYPYIFSTNSDPS